MFGGPWLVSFSVVEGLGEEEGGEDGGGRGGGEGVRWEGGVEGRRVELISTW